MTESPASGSERVGVLFVCYANVCRSPLAEGVFRHLVEARGLAERFVIDSAGTHAIEGAHPHPLSQEIALAHGFTLDSRGRQLLRHDLSRFDHVVVMDRMNHETIRRLAAPSAFGAIEGFRARIRHLREISDPRAHGRDLDVPDPIRGGAEGYQLAYEFIERGCEALLDETTG